MFNFELIVSCPGSYLPREKDLRASTRGLCAYSLQWHSYVYAKTHLRTHLDQEYGNILSQF